MRVRTVSKGSSMTRATPSAMADMKKGKTSLSSFRLEMRSTNSELAWMRFS
jgi:hypothetical protein